MGPTEEQFERYLDCAHPAKDGPDWKNNTLGGLDAAGQLTRNIAKPSVTGVTLHFQGYIAVKITEEFAEHPQFARGKRGVAGSSFDYKKGVFHEHKDPVILHLRFESEEVEYVIRREGWKKWIPWYRWKTISTGWEAIFDFEDDTGYEHFDELGFEVLLPD